MPSRLLQLILLLLPWCLSAQQPADQVDRLAPDFVQVSVLVANPSDVLYSCYGHAALRLQCPTYQLDYTFTCEGEPAADNVRRFLLGQLQMGVYAFATSAYLDEYAQQGRGVTQYPLNLPPQAKLNLWQQMDERVQFPHTPYDYVTHGCTHLVLQWITQCLPPQQQPIFHQWPSSFSQSRKVIAGQACRAFPWNHLIIGSLVDGSLNSPCPKRDKVILPADLIFVLQHATLDGQPLLQPSAQPLLTTQRTYGGTSLLAPLPIALLILALTGLFWAMSQRRRAMRLTRLWCYLLLAMQFLLGLFFTYLVVFSTLPCTEWNWLLLPLNPLLPLLWRWRRSWRRPWLLLTLVWCLGLLTLPFMCHDWAYIPLALSLAILPFIGQKPHNPEIQNS